MHKRRIVCDSDILSGKPIIEGTRISVALVLQCIGSGMTVDNILKGYPTLKKEDVFTAIKFAARQIEGEEIKILEKV